ncbi:MAG: DUF835 domain-containing protein [Thermoplasmata archaeon]
MHSDTEWNFDVVSEEDIISARDCAIEIAEKCGFNSTEVTAIGTAVSELGRNIYEYAKRGTITIRVESNGASLCIIAKDAGPGIKDIESILSGKYRSRHGLGAGLIGVKRLMDAFNIESEPGKGTTVTCRKFKKLEFKVEQESEFRTEELGVLPQEDAEIEEAIDYPAVWVNTNSSEDLYKLFRRLGTKHPTLCITFRHPERLREKYGLETTPIIYLTNISTKYKYAFAYDRFEFEVLFNIISFIKENPHSYVLFDGADILSGLQKNFEKVYSMLKGVADICSMCSSTLLLHFLEQALPHKHAAYLRNIAYSYWSKFEKKVPKKYEGGIQPGDCYLIDRKFQSMDVLESIVGKYPLLVVTSKNLSVLKKNMNFDSSGIQFFRISGALNEGSDVFSPFDTTRIFLALTNFLKSKHGCIYIDALPEFMSASEFREVLVFIKDLIDEVTEYLGTLIVDTDHEIFEPWQFALLERVFDQTFKEEKPPGTRSLIEYLSMQSM